MLSNPYALPAVPRVAQCKVCAAAARIAGVVDFSRCGADVGSGRKVDPYDGTPVYYYVCTRCGFVFTPAFDHWDRHAFARHVYNDDYVRHDPDYLDARPRSSFELIQRQFDGVRSDPGGILDYGSGHGLLEVLLRETGYPLVHSFDPFSSPQRPTQQYALIVCFEVMEHTLTPHELLADMKSFLLPHGALLFSTLLCSQAVLDRGLENWWYCVPRSGHVSFYSSRTLMTLAQLHGLHLHSFRDQLHVFYQDDCPAWLAAHLPRRAVAAEEKTAS